MPIDKCKKNSVTITPCDEMRIALNHGLLRMQSLRNFATNTSRQRVVVTGPKKQEMGLIYCPFCRIHIAIPAVESKPQE